MKLVIIVTILIVMFEIILTRKYKKIKMTKKVHAQFEKNMKVVKDLVEDLKKGLMDYGKQIALNAAKEGKDDNTFMKLIKGAARDYLTDGTDENNADADKDKDENNADADKDKDKDKDKDENNADADKDKSNTTESNEKNVTAEGAGEKAKTSKNKDNNDDDGNISNAKLKRKRHRRHRKH
jgi:hypothetical protein